MKARSKTGFAGQRAQRLERRPDAQLDLVRDARLLPVASPDRRPLAAHVEREHAAVVGQAARQAERRVAREGADLDHPLRAQRACEPAHEGALLGRDLHPRDAPELCGLLDQRLLHRVGRRTVRHQIGVQLGRDGRVLGGVGHGGSSASRGSSSRRAVDHAEGRAARARAMSRSRETSPRSRARRSRARRARACDRSARRRQAGRRARRGRRRARWRARPSSKKEPSARCVSGRLRRNLASRSSTR